MRSIPLDAHDRRILAALQRDATLSINALSEAVGLSPTPCWKRVKRLEETGVITGRVALIDREKVDLGVTVFVAIRTSRHDLQWSEQFCSKVKRIPEVVEFYRMSGETDYLLRVVVPNIKAYDDVYKRLIATAELFDVSSSFAMECIKYTTALPLNHAS